MASVHQWRAGWAAAGVAAAVVVTFFAPMLPARLGEPLVFMAWIAAGCSVLRAMSGWAMGRGIERGYEQFVAAAAGLFEKSNWAGSGGVTPSGYLSERISGAVTGTYDGRATVLEVWREFETHDESGASSWRDFRVRAECFSALDFTAKRWGVSGGPPYHPGWKAKPELQDGLVDFTTADERSFQFWRTREDCRAAAEALILKHGAAAVRVESGSVQAWWHGMRWKEGFAPLPGVLEGVARLARLIDGRPAGRPVRRPCGSCAGTLGPGDGWCPQCGKPWWEKAPSAKCDAGGVR